MRREMFATKNTSSVLPSTERRNYSVFWARLKTIPSATTVITASSTAMINPLHVETVAHHFVNTVGATV